MLFCGELEDPANGMVTYSMDTAPSFEFGTMATYSCLSDYALSVGDTVRTCGPRLDVNGDIVAHWSGQAPSCIRE